ncbi:2-polyprenyl-6-methoxyphenol hydroxylase-like FAD-dependent oxidoreductase [Halopolyspora algeriensis]|uniref:2-polyprenyl-6-methoxyphenol hydroxylase-like FAD-dependent oxidoreductase n=1 Tax=Halopolyspora algeriensis TaxID=1500506 RepID=A0A368VGY8_9ACTN|nr:styrene monooxygenase/indole monooxygenase family protein [Halopolyspora algeriensis]RCW40447.1 2-polyprenyl-6-methoxyphenol hydroxylase-like FAD-dependent oxidoreductase [Halopolyspora algeriensis]TQM53730.1 2-polyprenyl-6-methoxyphenol hydroxylase-like FAD-dependent oxidoreductase [Halopolyspora algeriensis]
MRKILIIGAGQAGLQLGLSLLDHDYDVTVMSARTPEEIRGGRVMSTQAMFHTALQHERDHKLNLWEDQAPEIEGLGLSLAGPDGSRALDWVGWLDNYGQSIDQRIKMAGWLELFEERGGKAIFHGVTTADLDGLIKHYELVLVAAGKGELVQLFHRNPERSPYTAPQRMLSVSYVHGGRRRPEHPDADAVRFNVVPGVGELFVIPGFTLSGPCEIPFFEGLPGGPLDCWSDRPGPAEHWNRMRELMRQYFPWEYDRFKDAELTDPQATLTGGYAPVVRHPVAKLPSGGHVLGMADVVVANDPITGQGSNNASKCAASYLDSILERGEQPFDAQWMEDAFERYWSRAEPVTRWTNTMLQPPPEHVMNLFGAAQENETIRTRFVNGFDNPADFDNWFLDPVRAEEYLKQVG